MTRVALVPGALALLPEYAGTEDSIAELRAACVEAVAWLGADAGFGVHGSPQGLRIARSLADHAGVRVDLDPEHPPGMLVIGNGSAARAEKAPGHLDERAGSFDDALRRALTVPDPQLLAAIDRPLAKELWADVDSLVWLGAELLTTEHRAIVDYDDDPFGVQYWVIRWEREG
jgi:hypothetical protein